MDRNLKQEAFFGEQLDRANVVNAEPQSFKIINPEGRHDIQWACTRSPLCTRDSISPQYGHAACHLWTRCWSPAPTINRHFSTLAIISPSPQKKGHRILN